MAGGKDNFINRLGVFPDKDVSEKSETFVGQRMIVAGILL